jgi:hypothetical protein
VIFLTVGTRDEVDRIHSRAVEGGHRSKRPPSDAFWGSRYAILEDPDGTVRILCGTLAATTLRAGDTENCNLFGRAHCEQ